MLKKWLPLIIVAFVNGFSVHVSAKNLALDPDHSALYFTSTKKGAIAETHQIKQLTGSVINGKVTVTLPLNSVDTHIQIRDERVKKFLFETALFPQAFFTTQLDMTAYTSLDIGSSLETTIEGTLDLHGVTQSIKMPIHITKFKEGSLQAYTIQPIIINAAAFNLVKGVDKLRDLAGLPSVSYAVPVNFKVVFR